MLSDLVWPCRVPSVRFREPAMSLPGTPANGRESRPVPDSRRPAPVRPAAGCGRARTGRSVSDHEDLVAGVLVAGMVGGQVRVDLLDQVVFVGAGDELAAGAGEVGLHRAVPSCCSSDADASVGGSSGSDMAMIACAGQSSRARVTLSRSSGAILPSPASTA